MVGGYSTSSSSMSAVPKEFRSYFPVFFPPMAVPILSLAECSPVLDVFRLVG